MFCYGGGLKTPSQNIESHGVNKQGQRIVKRTHLFTINDNDI